MSEIQYAERILPEIIWVSYLIKRLGSKREVEVAGFINETSQSLRSWTKQPDFALLSSYKQLSETDWLNLETKLKANGVFMDCLDSLTPFVRCYPRSNPFSNLLKSAPEISALEENVSLARVLIAGLFDRRCQHATLVQSVSLSIDIKTGKLKTLPDFPFQDFATIFGDFESVGSEQLCANARMHTNLNFAFYKVDIGDSWAKYFWNRGRELTPLAAANAPRPRLTTLAVHPFVAFGMDFEEYAWTVVDAIWAKLPVDICQSEFYEVIGALLARQWNLANKIARNADLWDYHAGPLFLRTMPDCYITAAWICKDRVDIAQKFILFGLGQEKLEIERLKSMLNGLNDEEKKRLQYGIDIQETWLNGQHYSFLQHVDVGSWSGISTRKMAEDAGCLDLYDFSYTGWSHAAHGTWNHVGRFDAMPTNEPLHKYIWQPANLEHGLQVDVVEQATGYFDDLCCLIVKEFDLKMEIQTPMNWLEKRLETLFEDIE